jgi:hypothetical protein
MFSIPNPEERIADVASQYNSVLSLLCRKTFLYWYQVGYLAILYMFFIILTLGLLRSFAWAEMRMIAANILSRYDVIEVPGQEVDFRQFITMQFHTGHWKVVLKARK